MAKSFKEIRKKTESLIEQGRETDSRVHNCQARVYLSTNRVNAAMAQLEAASETDEEGNPIGDVEYAILELGMAQQALAASQRALAYAQSDADYIKRQKHAQISDIERHNEIEKNNLSKLRQLKSKAFGSNTDAISQEIAARLNEAEMSRVALLHSMGIEAKPEYVSEDSESNTGINSKPLSFSPIDLSGQYDRFQGGGQGNSIGGVSSYTTSGNSANSSSNHSSGYAPTGGTANTTNGYLINNNDIAHTARKEFNSMDDLSDEIDFYARDYQSNPEKYNDIIRNNGTSKEIEAFRKIISEHQILEDTTFFRRASLMDIGLDTDAVYLEELVGKTYQFQGIMSASGDMALANSVSDGNVIYEIKVPAGTNALDLTKVSYFQEVMFSSPTCYIESARKEGYNTTHLVVRIIPSNTEKSVSHVDHQSDTEKWNTEYMPLVKANIRQSVKDYFSDYVSEAKLESCLETLGFMNQEELRQRYETSGVKVPNGLLGFNDGESSLIAHDIKSHTINGRVGDNVIAGSGNVKINYAFVTAVHENLHMLSANDYMGESRRGLMVGNNEVTRAMNEAFTEYFTFLSCGGEKYMGGLYPGQYSGYHVLMQEMPTIEKAVGRDCMMSAYFNNNPQLIRNKIDSLLENGAWDKMCYAAYDLFYNDNKCNGGAVLGEMLGRLK
jgi:hypothetical protein